MPLTHQDLAEMSGTNIYSVSRVLRKWEAEKIIATGRKRILLRAPERLSLIS
jgi:CRP-like cAMP-binding protein